MADCHFTILGVPFNGIGVPPEQENPARAIRDAGLVESLLSRGAAVVDLGDLEIPPFAGHRDELTGVLNLDAWKVTSLRLSDRLAPYVDNETTLLILGGDCGILLGIIGAYVRRGRRIGLISLDGHADFRNPEASPSGEAADMPLWVLTGRGPAELSGLYGMARLLDDGDIAVFGYRDPDLIDTSSIAGLDRERMAEVGIEGAATEGLQPLLDRGMDLWLHFDVDVIDPLEMPAVHFPEPGGLSIKEATELARRVMDSARVVGFSLACYHNNDDPGGLGAASLVKLMTEVLT
jgi:arginase